MNYSRYTSSVILLLLLTGIGFSGCKKDFLIVPDTSSTVRETYVKDIQATAHYLNGIYVQLAQNFYIGYSEMYPEIIADNIKPALGSPSYLNHYTWTQQSSEVQAISAGYDDINMNGVWTCGYSIARACSYVIDQVNLYRDQDTILAKSLLGQAYGLRALAHAKLVDIFAQSYNFSSDGAHLGIPYVKSSELTEPVSRLSVKEVYGNITNDYLVSIQLLNEINTSSRLNANAVAALLSRAYLNQEKYDSALYYADQVIDQVNLMSIGEGYPNAIFAPNASYPSETLFQLAPKKTDYGTSFVGELALGYLIFEATADLGLLLTQDVNDIRSGWVDNSSGVWTIKKFPPGIVPDISPGEGGYYHNVIRVSEMYLIAAESSAMLANEDDARLFLNAIRLRANPAAVPVSADGALLMQSIQEERRKN